MKTPIFSIINVVFVIIGTVIGAGFISGREVLSFFNNQSIVFATILIFVLFSSAFYLLLSIKNLPDRKIIKVFEPLVLFSNLIILSGMISAIDELTFSLFPILKKFPFFSIITLILSNFIVSKGVDGLKRVNMFLVPIIILFILTALFTKKTFNIENRIKLNLFSLCCYVGVNTFTSSVVFIDLGKKLSKKESFFSALLSSFILSLLILLIYSSLSKSGDKITNSAIPMLEYLEYNKVLYSVYSIIAYFGIVTTLISAHYPLFNFAKNFQKQKIAKAFVLLIAFAISRFGFYNIVNYLYPITGVIGIIYLIVISILSRFSQLSKRQGT
ncbi:MAG: hypothetical protein IJF75_04420 [Clostridia bacterium]|nr:hypothetical protein [Clostridia bacterium]